MREALLFNLPSLERQFYLIYFNERGTFIQFTLMREVHLFNLL